MVDLNVTGSTVTMLPPANAAYSKLTYNSRFYNVTAGVPVQVLSFDVPILQSLGWAIVLQNVQLQPLTLSSASFAVGVPQGTVVGDILAASPGSTITFDSLSTAGALQIVGTSLQVGPTPPAVAGTITFNLIESFTGAVNSPRQTNGFSVSLVDIITVPVNTAIPAISGTALLGQLLTATNGTWTNNPTGFAYQWNRNGVPISGATFLTYLVAIADIGTVLTVSVVASNSSGSSGPVASTATSTVSALVPVNTAVPTITGTAEVGQTLTASNGTWTETPTSYAHQWYRGAAVIVGANAPSYVIMTADVGSALSVSVVATNIGGASLPAASAATAAVVAIAPPPSVLPTFFALGLKSSPVTGWWMPQSGILWNYRYQYLNSGWENWNTPSGAIVTLYTQFSIANGYIPVFTWYLAGSQMSGNPATLWSNLATPSYMNAYFTSFQLMLQKAGAFTNPVIAHIEPDMWSFMQQQKSSNPTTITVSVASSGFSGLSGFPNNASGLAQALISLRNTYAANVLLAWDNCLWAVNYDPTTTASPTTAGTSVAGFYNLLAANFDLIFYNTSDADSAYKVIVRGIASAQAWWNNTAFDNVRQYISTIYQATGRKSLLWQTPVGNTLYRSCNNTPGHYQDNRPEYFLNTGNRQRIVDYANVGVIGILFGEGQEILLTSNPATSYLDQMGDGITNPSPVSPGSAGSPGDNILISTYPDDDGGFLRTSAVAYYLNPVQLSIAPPPVVPVITVIPTISGTPRVGQTLTASTGTWTNSPASYAYQWKRAGAVISGATASTYVPAALDVGITLTVSVTATNAAGPSVQATSLATNLILAATTLVFPPDTTNYPLISQVTMSLPAYLVATTDTSLGNKIMRISDETAFGGFQPRGAGKMIKHHYSKDAAWNADESLIFLHQAKYPGALLDGTTYQYLRQVPFTTANERVWSNTNKDLLYGVHTTTRTIRKFNVQTEVDTIIATFAQYSALSLGQFEGNMSDDDRYMSIMAQSGSSLVVFTYDLVSNVVVGSRTFANTNMTNNINFTTMTPSGNYVAILFNNTALGFPAATLQIYDRQMNHIRQAGPYASHVDFTYDSTGNEVVVGKNSTNGDIWHAYIYTVKLSTGGERAELPVGIMNNPIHISCRNTKRPGWAYISEAPATDPTHPVSWYNTFFNYNEVFALKLDGTGTIERFAKEHHVTDPTFNQLTNDGYNRSPMAVPSRYGDRVIFASDWGDASTSAFIHSYVAWWP